MIQVNPIYIAIILAALIIFAIYRVAKAKKQKYFLGNEYLRSIKEYDIPSRFFLYDIIKDGYPDEIFDSVTRNKISCSFPKKLIENLLKEDFNKGKTSWLKNCMTSSGIIIQLVDENNQFFIAFLHKSVTGGTSINAGFHPCPSGLRVLSGKEGARLILPPGILLS